MSWKTCGRTCCATTSRQSASGLRRWRLARALVRRSARRGAGMTSASTRATSSTATASSACSRIPWRARQVELAPRLGTPRGEAEHGHPGPRACPCARRETGADGASRTPGLTGSTRSCSSTESAPTSGDCSAWRQPGRSPSPPAPFAMNSRLGGATWPTPTPGSKAWMNAIPWGGASHVERRTGWDARPTPSSIPGTLQPKWGPRDSVR